MPLDTVQDIMEFIAAGEAEGDPVQFWESLGVDYESFATLMQATAYMLPKNGAAAIVFAEIGARLALQSNLAD